ncbi:hypothetical protein [Pedobacter mendelii]|uniref:Glycerophosphoryl diester phosphodiesterase membrane domain-containing protein n=1 Tax=Pedobacter mendelii TaxID=1908240 RepID=A0ABQ2BCU9_9SPHI|nr:hypothetical protein [Pedobacter mendelii]GGI22977.1 hypothetical protein GCM10008119_05360 [Pedobacter mendelii]
MLLKIEFKKIRDFGQIINDTFTFIRQNFKPLVKNYFIFCGLFVLGGMLSMLLQQYKTVNMINSIDSNTAKDVFGFATLYGIEYYLAILFSLAGYASTTVVTLSYIAVYVQKGNETPTIDEVWGYFKYYFFRVFGSSILLILLLIFGFLFCLVPGFWLFPFIAMIFPIMIIENGTLSYSFTRSFKIIKDNFWLTFGTLIIIWIIVYACMSIVVLPTTLFSMIGMFASKKPHMSLTFTMLTTVLQYLCQVCTVIPIVTITLSYFSLVEQKESTGLMERISNFGITDKPADTRPEEY